MCIDVTCFLQSGATGSKCDLISCKPARCRHDEFSYLQLASLVQHGGEMLWFLWSCSLRDRRTILSMTWCRTTAIWRILVRVTTLCLAFYIDPYTGMRIHLYMCMLQRARVNYTGWPPLRRSFPGTARCKTGVARALGVKAHSKQFQSYTCFIYCIL